MSANASAPLLDVRNLKVWFPIRRGLFGQVRGHVRAVDDVSLSIYPRETLGLVGESGCGKTTLGRTIMGLEHATAGEILMDGRNLAALDETERRPFRRRLQMVFQDPFSSLNPRLTVLDILTEGMIQHSLIPRAQRRAAAMRLLAEVGMNADGLHRYPHEFSGGQRQRISVARAISLQPEFIVCDEAVSALDVSIRAQVLNLLLDLRTRHGLAYLFISHDLSVVRHIAERVAVMYLGQIVEIGTCAEVLERPAHPYTRALLSAVPVPRGPRGGGIVLRGDVPSPANPPSGCRFHPRCLFAIDACRRDEPCLEAMAATPDGTRRVACLRKNEI